MKPLVDQLLDHAQALRWDALPGGAVQAAVTFITDSVAVGLAGSRHPRLPQLLAAAQAWGRGDAAREWASGQRWPVATAAMINAYQVHNQEFDCVHEAAVVHPLATILPALVAQAEAQQLGQGQAVSGAQLIEALVLAVDVATTLGCAHIAPMRFFRPAMCGAMGAALGVAKLVGCSRAEMANALGLAYSQLAGTMQAHAEGSPALALQVALASRAAVMAVDLARAGFAGPHNVIEGPFGYFDLFDAPLTPRLTQVQQVFADVFGAAAATWSGDSSRRRGSHSDGNLSGASHSTRHRITELSHKPFPTGRAAHGALDGLATLQADHGFASEDVAAVELAAPPLILRLVGRPWRADMDANYARLCLPYLVATALRHGAVTLAHFSPAALADNSLQTLAARVSCKPNGVTDVNALAPQTLSVSLCGGQTHSVDLPAVLGHPQRPLSATAQRAKFDACCAHAGLAGPQRQALHDACTQLPASTDLLAWLELMRVPSRP